MVFQRKHDAKTLTVVAADVTTLPSVDGSQSRPGKSVIGNDMSIEGQSITVRCKGSLRVNGAIEADLHCAELIVGEQAFIKGSIAADSVRVFGQVNGAILGASDQFATGLSGARSPYGTCSSIGNPLYVSGGSSSGSAVTVAAGQVSFALGTDTGGSGRIPAGFNGVVGIKPTVGRVSTRGLVPNCPTA